MKGEAFYILDALKKKIEPTLKYNIHNNSLSSKCGEVLQLVYNHLESVEEVAKSTLDTELNQEISRHIKGLNWKLDANNSKSEDVIQNEVMEEIVSFTPQLKMLVHKCSDGLYNTFPDDEEINDDVHGAVSSDMIGVCEVYQQLKDKLLSSQQVISLVGMPGIGKTTLANKIFNDPEVVECFDHRVWIRLGKKYRRKDIPRRMLQEIDPDGLQMLSEGDKEAVHEYLSERLKSKKYLIVLDNVWDFHVMDFFLSYITNEPFLHPECGSRILFTIRLHQLDKWRAQHDRKDMNITMRLLNKKESWDLGSGGIAHIMSLTLKQCYKLEKIHGMFGKHLERIRLVDCNPSCVEEIKKALRSKNTCKMDVHSSWEDE